MTLHRRDLLAGGAAGLLVGGSAFADETAAEIVARESALAAQDGKRLLLVFHASWCVWCTQMDMMLEDPVAAEILGAHFRILHLQALERSDEARAQQFAGADEVYLGYAGEPAGLPFLAVLDADAQALATSVTDPEAGNFGFPVKDWELDGFEAMLEAAAPAMSAADRATLRAVCVRVMEA